MASRTFTAPLVGRVDDLAQLEERLADIDNGTAQIVVLGGEAGIGKSRLLAEFLQRHDGVTTATGHCLELGPDGPPFAPMGMLLRSLVAELGKERVAALAGAALPDLAVLAPELAATADSEPSGRSRLFDGMATVLEHTSEDRPLIVVLEDLHWSDSSTRDLIAFLARTISDARILFVLTYRKDELPRRHPLHAWLREIERLPQAHRVTLERLSAADTELMVRQLVGDVPDRITAGIRRRSEGIPFFIEELTTSCGSGGVTAALPDNLRDLMLARLDVVSEDTRELVRMASAANTQVDHDVLSRLVDLIPEALDGCLREAVAAAILTVDGTREGYAFRHALMREAVHEDLLPGEHARLHARYAAALAAAARPEQAGEIAHHWISAHESGQSFDWSLKAADYSRSVYAWQEELTHLDRALDLWDQVDQPQERAGCDRADLLARAGRAAGDVGRPDMAIALYDAALPELDPTTEPRRVARLLIGRAGQCEISRPDGLADLARARELAGPGTREGVSAMAHTAAQLMLLGRLTESQTWAELAIDAATALGAEDLAANSHNTLGGVLLHTGQPDEGLEHLSQSRDLAIAADDWPDVLRYYGNTSDAFISIGRFADAAALAREGRTLAEQRGWIRTMGSFLGGNEVEAMVLAGDWDAASVVIDEVLRLEPPPFTRAAIHMHRATIRLRRGDVDGSADDLDAAADRLGHSVVLPQYALPMAWLRAWHEFLAGDSMAALSRLAEAATAAGNTPPTASGWPFVFAYACILDGVVSGNGTNKDAAWAEAAGQLRGMTEALDAGTGHDGWRRLLAAQLAGIDEPLQTDDAPHEPTDWESAVAALDACEGLVFEAAYARIRLGEQLLSLGQREGGRDVLLAAWDAIGALRAEALKPLAQRVAAAGRIQLRRTERSADLLTPREQEVLDLIAAGRSNRAISDELVISIKTTSVHVSHILAKIGASSRTEAAAWALRSNGGPAG